MEGPTTQETVTGLLDDVITEIAVGKRRTENLGAIDYRVSVERMGYWQRLLTEARNALEGRTIDASEGLWRIENSGRGLRGSPEITAGTPDGVVPDRPTEGVQPGGTSGDGGLRAGDELHAGEARRADESG